MAKKLKYIHEAHLAFDAMRLLPCSLRGSKASAAFQLANGELEIAIKENRIRHEQLCELKIRLRKAYTDMQKIAKVVRKKI